MKSPTTRAVIAAVSSVVVVVGGLLMLLWLLVDGNPIQASIRLELVRVALTILLGTGGLFGLYLAWRRQRSTEIALQQKERDQVDVARAFALQERTALAGEADAAARRITDLYTKAVEQLGSDKAPVRLGGLYALERLAQNHDEQRQTIVSVLCAYLRMPYSLPGAPPAENTDATLIDAHRERTQEREVRVTAQRILTSHLCFGEDPNHPAANYWGRLDLDFTDATLIDFDFDWCAARNAKFGGATFAGQTRFQGATFAGDATFSRATFTGRAWFQATEFLHGSWFEGVTFAGTALFEEAAFGAAAWFKDVTFAGKARFDGATFTRNAQFSGATFIGDARFAEVTFTAHTLFKGATFVSDVSFINARFKEGIPSHVQDILSKVANQVKLPDAEGDE